MKKIIIIITALISFSAVSQQEVKLDVFDALALKTLDISYEYFLSDDSSIGISGLFNFEKSTSDFKYKEKQVITPYFRHYFTSHRVWNLFGEAFLAINSGDSDKFKSYTDGALGIAIGSKYSSNSGFIVDIYGGLGRNLFGTDSPSIVPRVGLNVGFRF